MLEPSNQVSLQRRANWVGLRTLRQRPKPVGTMPDGEPVYEIRSVRVVLRGLSPHFDRLATCSRCTKEIAAAPVLTVADLDRPLRPLICTECVRETGVSTVWTPGAAAPVAEGEPAAPPPAAEGPAAEAPAGVDEARYEAFERHLRTVTARVNQLGQIVWAQRSEAGERRLEEEAARVALERLREQVAALSGVGEQVALQRSELAAVVSAVGDVRAELQRLSDGSRELVRAHQDLDRRLGERPAPAVTQEELAAIVAAQQELARRLAEAEAEAQRRDPGADVAGEVAAGVAEVERRLEDQIAGQRGDLETAIERSVRMYAEGVVRAHEELAATQADMAQRVEALAAQVAQITGRVEAVASWAVSVNDRLDAAEERAERALVGSARRLEPLPWEAPSEPGTASSEGLLETLERQLQAATSRLAARSERAPADS